MKSNYAPILYVFLIVLFMAALGLLFLRQGAAEYLNQSAGINSIEVVVRKSLPASELIDTEVLESERLVSLKNNVKIFTFEDICGDSINSPKKCVKGNNNPFAAKK